MSTQSGYPPPPGAGGYPQATEPPEKKPNLALFWTLAILVAVALGVGGYFFGKSQGESNYDPGTEAYGAIYDKGYASGKQSGTASGAAAGQQAGEKQGQQAGLQEGTKQGQAQGTKQGASTALGGFSSWQTGNNFYVIQMSTGPQPEVPFVISSRVLMDPTLVYTPCQDNPGNLCTFPIASTGGASAQAGNDTGTTTTDGGPGAQAGDDTGN